MKKNKLPLSIIILTHRNDERFEKCLASAQFAQEIIVEKHENIVDFSQARNNALKKTTQPWVFFLDSDEVISDDSVRVIEEILSNNNLDGVFIKRKDIFYGKILEWGEVRNVWLLRMFKKGKAKFVRPVHEKAIVQGSVKKMPIIINHHAHLSVAGFIEDISKYSEIEAKFRLKKSEKNFKKNKIIIEMLIFPPAKFIFNFFLKLGFLDGWRGLIYAMTMSIHSIVVRIFLYELTKTNNN